MKAGITLFVILALYFFASVYGFVSYQYGFALPFWGWSEIADAPSADVDLRDSNYKQRAAASLELLESWRSDHQIPSVSAAVVSSRKLIWAAAVGWADIEERCSATTQTSYRIGSTSKAVTSTLLARLVDGGTISLDTPISDYLTLENSQWAAITPRQLASHTAGLVGYENNNDWLGAYQSLLLNRHYDDPEDALEIFDGSTLLFPPGHGFSYSSFDVVLLSAVMQAASSTSYQNLIAEHVREPLHLSTPVVELEAESAVHYFIRDGVARPWRNVDLSQKMASGGLIAKPQDLALMASYWLDVTYIKRNTRDDFWKPVRLNNGTVNEQDYAIGWRRKVWRVNEMDVLNLNHGGVSKGAQCWLMIVPEHDLVLALTINARTENFKVFSALAKDLLSIFLTDLE